MLDTFRLRMNPNLCYWIGGTFNHGHAVQPDGTFSLWEGDAGSMTFYAFLDITPVSATSAQIDFEDYLGSSFCRYVSGIATRQ